MSDDEPALSVEEFVEYCETQAGLLAGSAETMREDLESVLDDIDAELSAMRQGLEDAPEAADHPGGTPTEGSDENRVDVDAMERREADLESRQAVAEATQARMEAYRSLADGYADLAADLQSSVDDGRTALESVVRFEAERDAPAYFDDRQTVVEAAAASTDDGDE